MMDMFNNDILNITEIHGLLKKPRDLSKEEFELLCFYDTVRPKHIIRCRNTSTAFVEMGVLDSLSDFRRQVKGNALSVGSRKIKDFNDEFLDEDFFETGLEGCKWTSIRRGKKTQQIVLIIEDEILYPDDPWFGQTFDEWKELNLHL